MSGDNLQDLIVSYTHVGPELHIHVIKLVVGILLPSAPDRHISLSHVYWCLRHVFLWPVGTAIWHNLQKAIHHLKDVITLATKTENYYELCVQVFCGQMLSLYIHRV